MRTTALCLLTTLLFVTPSPASAQKLTFERLKKKILPATAQIKVYLYKWDPRKEEYYISGIAQGTAFMLKWGQPRGVLITNVHVLAGVEFYKGRMIGVYARRFATANWVRIRTVYAASRSADLAILECPFKGPWLTASVKWPKRGETVYAIGWPKGKFAITAGKVVPKDRFDREILKKNTWRGFRHSAATARGSSGGPIINANGYFLGVHFAASAPLSETKKRGYAIDKNTLDQVVKRYAKRAVR